MDELLTPADAARILGVVPATVRAMERRGVLTAARKTVQGHRLFSQRDVEALAKARAKTATGKAHAPSRR